MIIWEGDVSRDVSYVPGGEVDLVRVVFSRCIPSALKMLSEAVNM